MNISIENKGLFEYLEICKKTRDTKEKVEKKS